MRAGLVRSILLVVLALAAVLAPAAQAAPPATPFSQAAPAAPAAKATPAAPGAVVAPLMAKSAETPVITYAEMIRAADGHDLRVAVVDPVRGWVAATDNRGRVVAAPVTRATAGAIGKDSAAAKPRGPLPSVLDLPARLRADGVALVAPVSTQTGPTRSTMAMLMPMLMLGLLALVIGGVLVARSRRGGSGRGPAGNHGRMRSGAQVLESPVRFADVAGCDEVRNELEETVEFLRDASRFAATGARMPRGVILYGPPGTGKTLLAKAVAGEAGVPFFGLSGSDFVDTYVGVGASRVRDLFTQARKAEKAVIFVDEIDAIGRRRGANGGADSEREGTLNQLLVELDGFGARDQIVVIAATNRLDMLDDALTRPGRFDRRVQVSLPAERGRREILEVHSKGKPLADRTDLDRLAAVTAGFSGADLANLLNEAAIMAARGARSQIMAMDLEEGMLRAIAGPQKLDRALAEGELERIAWHEAGHTLAAELCPTHVKAQKVTILARGQAAGLALYGASDATLHSPQQLHERMVVAMAGRAAEQVRFGTISSGAANDLEQVNRWARGAVERLGFSAKVGQLVTALPDGELRLSESTRRVIDEEVVRMVDEAYEEALGLLRAHEAELASLSTALLDREQIDRGEVEELLGALSHPTARRRPRLIAGLPASVRPPAPQPAPPAPPAPDHADKREWAIHLHLPRLPRLARPRRWAPGLGRPAVARFSPAPRKRRGFTG